jgi:hypothetical protein
MTNIRGKIFITETNSEIYNKVLKALKPELNKYLEKAFNKAKTRIAEAVINAIKNAPEYQSLLSGDLKYEFGLPDGDARVNYILGFWEKINVEYKKVYITGDKISGGFTLSMIDSDFSDVIGSAAAVFTTEKGTDLNWLEWLLLFGNKTIIRDYVVEFGPNPRSRTGKAVMKGVQSGKWSVPNEFSGTKNNNWITRAIESADSEINSILKEVTK